LLLDGRVQAAVAAEGSPLLSAVSPELDMDVLEPTGCRRSNPPVVPTPQSA
jgi:hypothetical protein